MRIILLLALAGCTSVSDSAICAGLKRPVAELRAALEANPQTPDPVGEAGTDVLLGMEAGCQ